MRQASAVRFSRLGSRASRSHRLMVERATPRRLAMDSSVWPLAARQFRSVRARWPRINRASRQGAEQVGWQLAGQVEAGGRFKN